MALDKLTEQKILSKISYLYYIENLNQQDIAQKMNISRTRISRYLSKARKNRIVEIKINSPWEEFEELETLIEKKFRIKECIITSSSDNFQQTCKQISISLSGLLDRILRENSLLGVGWGITLKTVTGYLEPQRQMNIKVVPLLGGLGKLGIELQTNTVASTLADKYGGIGYAMHSPAVLDSRENRDILEKDSSVSEIIAMFQKIDTAIIGLSDISGDSTMIKTGNFKIEDFKYLESLGVVGDVNLVFIDELGKQVANVMDERIVRISLEQILKVNNVIGIAFGPKKLKVIKGALTGKIIDILITDEFTAKQLV